MVADDRMRERGVIKGRERGRGNNPQDWMLTVSDNQEKAHINKREVSDDV